MLLVAGIDTLGAVADLEVIDVTQPGAALQHRHAILLGAARIDGGLVDHKVAAFEHAPNGFRGSEQRAQVGALVVVDRRGHRHDEGVAGAQGFGIGGVHQLCCGLQFRQFGLARAVTAGAQFGHTASVEVKADDRAQAAEFDSERQPDITQANDGEAQLWIGAHEDLR